MLAELPPMPSTGIAGVQFRENTDRESRFVALGVKATGELFLTWRDSHEDENPRTALGTIKLPVHLKLVRRGPRFEAFLSSDGINWGKPVAQHASESMGAEQKVGIWVTSGLNPTTTTAEFGELKAIDHD
jgi:hypothetical protein